MQGLVGPGSRSCDLLLLEGGPSCGCFAFPAPERVNFLPFQTQAGRWNSTDPRSPPVLESLMHSPTPLVKQHKPSDWTGSRKASQPHGGHDRGAEGTRGHEAGGHV